MSKFYIYDDFIYFIQVITLLFGIFSTILIISKMKNDSILTLVINIQLTILCSIYSVCFFILKLFSIDFSIFISPICDIGKIAMASIIMLIIQLNFVSPSVQPFREKIYIHRMGYPDYYKYYSIPFIYKMESKLNFI